VRKKSNFLLKLNSFPSQSAVIYLNHKINFHSIATKLLNANNVYWTAVSRQGCPTQMQNCFHNATPYLKDERLQATPVAGGACLAANVDETDIWHKMVPCNFKLFLACEGPTSVYAPSIVALCDNLN